MDKVRQLEAIVKGLEFQKGAYKEAEDQLIEFADVYAKMSTDDAKEVRRLFDSKERLGLFRVASSLFKKKFEEASYDQKDRLCRIFFAMYSFDNLEFGYDSVLDVIDIAPYLRDHEQLAMAAWLPFKALTSNSNARNNLENKIFATNL